MPTLMVSVGVVIRSGSGSAVVVLRNDRNHRHHHRRRPSPVASPLGEKNASSSSPAAVHHPTPPPPPSAYAINSIRIQRVADPIFEYGKAPPPHPAPQTRPFKFLNRFIKLCLFI